jgi:hypothetical protein
VKNSPDAYVPKVVVKNSPDAGVPKVAVVKNSLDANVPKVAAKNGQKPKFKLDLLKVEIPHLQSLV